MKILKFLVVILTLFSSFVFVYGYLDEKEVFDTLYIYYEKKPSTLYLNDYGKEISNNFVQLTNNFIAEDKQDLLNIYYTIIYSGMTEFTFYCSNSYIDCIDEVVRINEDEDILSQMNNFVNVYNSFKSLKTTFNLNGKVTVYVNKIYSDDDIATLNSILNEIESTIYNENDSEYDKILAIHDYIVNNTKYNVEDENKVGTTSSNAIGVFVKKLATCNGYTDAISLLLDRLNIPNARISNDKHIWNIVYTNGEWLHLDATWDDPINALDKDILSHDYFLKTTSEFEEIEKLKPDNKHDFNKEIYNFIK